MKLKRCKYAFVEGNVFLFPGNPLKIAFYCRKVVNFGNKKRSHFDYLHSDILYWTKDINRCLHGYRPCEHYEALEMPEICGTFDELNLNNGFKIIWILPGINNQEK